MKFFVIKRNDMDEVWFDFSKENDTYDLKSTCFLPTFDMAEGYIEDNLSVQYDVDEIELETLSESGTWSWSRIIDSWEVEDED